MPVVHNFIPGQCWSSEGEPELGIGFVRASDGSTVTLEFPLSGQARRYNKRSAPLKRLLIPVGEVAQSAAGVRFKVERANEKDGLITYEGEGKSLSETELSPKIRLHRPFQRLQANDTDPIKSYRLRQRALALASEHLSSRARGMVGPRARLLPHQLYVADQVASRAMPRALLADEVGLGKTIEAGWILHRLMVTGRARRILVIAPGSLVNQWFVELLRRFYLSFWVPTSQSLEAMSAEDLKEQERLIVSMDSLNDPTFRDGLLGAPWDLVIVDEAHRVAWKPGAKPGEFSEYELIERLAASSSGLLLLTATPEQLGLEGHFGRLRLVDPARFASYEGFLKEHDKYVEVLKDAETVLAKKGREAALELVDRHGTGRVYFRNSRRTLEKQEGIRFPARKLREHALGKKSLETWLGEFAKEHKAEKTLLICATAARAQALEAVLRDNHAVKAVAFHEDMALLARDRGAAYFEEEGGASILLSSELGGEGRNFQHASHLVLLDLPADPDVLEQRIGRLDRIGQEAETIQIHVPFVKDSRDEALMRWHQEVFGAFERPAQAAPLTYQRHREELEKLLEKGGKLDAFFKRASEDYAQDLKTIEEGRDRLIELHSFNPDAAVPLVKSIADAERPATLREFLETVFDVLGLHSEDLDAQSLFVEAGDSAFASYVPALPQEGMRFSLSREKAVARDDLALMSWDHPLVTGILESILSQELGNVTLGTWGPTVTATRTLAVECQFIFESHCETKWNLAEFFSPAPVRVVLEGTGKDVTDRWTVADFQGAVIPLPAAMESTARQLPTDAMRKLLHVARDSAELKGRALREMALNSMKTAIDAELSRLETLRARNPGAVGAAEATWWNERRAALSAALESARVRLDSFLVVVPKL